MGPIESAGTSATDLDDLVTELREYEAARAAMEQGALELAVSRLRRYLELRPNGRLDLEARLDLVEALVRLDRRTEALPLAEGLLVDPAIGSRRTEILRLLVELRVAVGDCARARELVPSDAPELLDRVRRCNDGGG